MKALLPLLALLAAPALAEPGDEAAPAAGAKASVGGGATLLSD